LEIWYNDLDSHIEEFRKELARGLTLFERLSPNLRTNYFWGSKYSIFNFELKTPDSELKQGKLS